MYSETNNQFQLFKKTDFSHFAERITDGFNNVNKFTYTTLADGRPLNSYTSHMAQFTSIGQYGFICLAVDTEGNMFGVHSMK